MWLDTTDFNILPQLIFLFYNNYKEHLLSTCFETDTILNVLSVQFSCSAVSDSLQPHWLQHDRPPCPSPTPGACSNSCPSSRWCHPTISSSVIPFSSCPQSFPASGSFQWVSSLHEVAKVLSFSISPFNEHQDWSPLGWTGWISLQSKRLSKVCSNTTVQSHQFFCTQLSLSPTLTSIHDYWKNILILRWYF